MKQGKIRIVGNRREHVDVELLARAFLLLVEELLPDEDDSRESA